MSRQYNTSDLTMKQLIRMPSYQAVYVTDTPPCLRDCGLDALPILTTKSHLYRAIDPNDHAVGWENIHNLSQDLHYPAFILNSFSDPGALVCFFSTLDADHKPVMASVKPKGPSQYQNIFQDSNFMTSLYGRNNFDTFLKRAFRQKDVLYWDERQSNLLFQKMNIQPPSFLKRAKHDPDFLSSITFHADYSKKKQFLIDMDGVMAAWSWVPSEDVLFEKGYYRDRPPMEACVESIRNMIQSGEDVYVLSAYLSNSHYAKTEKQEWLDEFLPEIPEDHRILVPYGSDKGRAACEALKIPRLDPNVILLDDYNVNLEAFQKAGGTPIKAMNGINGNTSEWKGAMLDIRDPFTVPEIIKAIEAPSHGVHSHFREDPRARSSLSATVAQGIADETFLMLQSLREDKTISSKEIQKVEKFLVSEFCSGAKTPREVIESESQGRYRKANILRKIRDDRSRDET